MLQMAQRAAADDLSVGLSTASDDATSRADESRGKTGGTAERLCAFLRTQLPAAARRFARAAERVMPAAAADAAKDAIASRKVGSSAGAAARLDEYALEAEGLAEWRERLRALMDDLADAIEGPAHLATQRLETLRDPLVGVARHAADALAASTKRSGGADGVVQLAHARVRGGWLRAGSAAGSGRPTV